MKNIIVLLAGLMMAGAAVADNHAGMNAEFRFRGKMDQNKGFKDKATEDTLSHRLKMGKSFKLNDKVSANLTLVHNADWGMNGNDDVTAANTQTPGTENTLNVNEAYMTWQVSDQLHLKAGRGAYEMADGSVIAKNDYQNVMTAFDGVAAVYEAERFRLTGWGVRFEDTATDEQANSVGAAFDFKSLPDAVKSLNVHVMQNNSTTAATTPKSRQTRYGLTVGGDVAGVDYKLTYAGSTGEVGVTPVDVSGSMIDAEVGYALPVMNGRVYLGYHTDSGDDSSTAGENEAYNNFYYDVHNNAGYMDLVTWGNLTYLKAGVTLDLQEKLNLGVHYHMFTATEEADVSNTTLGTVATEDEIGSEIDVELAKKYDNGVSVKLAYRMFQAGDRFGSDPEDHNQLWFQTKVNF